MLHRTFIGRFGNLIFHSRLLGGSSFDGRTRRILFALHRRSVLYLCWYNRIVRRILHGCRTVYRIRPAVFRVDGLLYRCDILPVRLLHAFTCIRLRDRRTFMWLCCRFACGAAGSLYHACSIRRRRPSMPGRGRLLIALNTLHVSRLWHTGRNERPFMCLRDSRVFCFRLCRCRCRTAVCRASALGSLRIGLVPLSREYRCRSIIPAIMGRWVTPLRRCAGADSRAAAGQSPYRRFRQAVYSTRL